MLSLNLNRCFSQPYIIEPIYYKHAISQSHMLLYYQSILTAIFPNLHIIKEIYYSAQSYLVLRTILLDPQSTKY